MLCENYDSIPKYLPLKVNLNYAPNIYNVINFDFIEIPNNIVKNLKGLYKIDFTRFVPKYIATQETIIRKLFTTLLDFSNNTVSCLENSFYIHNKLITEFHQFSKGFNLTNTCYSDINLNVLVDMNNNMVMINDNAILLIVCDTICIYNRSNKNTIMFSSSVNYFESSDATLFFKIFFKENNDIVVNTIMNAPNTKIQYMTYNINSMKDCTTTYYYEKYENNLKLLSYSLQKHNGDLEEKYMKNNLYVEHDYNHSTDTSKLISQCMIGDNTGLHYRGKYEELKSKDNHKKTLTKDDTIIYNKENNIVLIDSINNMNLKEDIIIGWKVAKSANNEKRIIKLMIPIDAKKIRPIDKEYFYTKGKERCNKAIVMDIQLPMEEDEISMVPSEMVAYSYIYNDNTERFAYMVGKEVVPDIFDENENESCTHGIHFYRNRMSVFDVYVNK